MFIYQQKIIDLEQKALYNMHTYFLDDSVF